MLSNLKVHMSETVIQHFPSQNSPSSCTPHCLQKDHFWFWLVAAMFVYIHTKCSEYWLDGLESTLNPPNG